MKPFAFRLDRILRLRQDAERRQARRLGEVTREEARLEAACREQAQHLEQLSRGAQPVPGQATFAGWIRVLSLVAHAAEQRLDETERSRAAARELVEAERQRLTAARAEHRSLARLRERQHDAWSEEERRAERKTMDEVASRRHQAEGEP